VIVRRRILTVALSAAVLVLAACSGDEPEAATPTLTVTPTPEPTPTPTPVVFDPAAAYATVEHLATRIGPREAASPAFDEAAAYVQSRFEALGYAVATVPVPVPAGDSWGVPVDAGTSANVIASPPGFDDAEPHVVIGAHLDTVAVAPGAEDNASGIGVMLDLARMTAAEPPGLPVRFIAFGAEEPRGRGDALHHFGSQDYVAGLAPSGRRAVAAMLSLDRVGVPGEAVPVSTGGTGTTAVMDALIAAADSAGIATQAEQNRSSDHWSFEKADIPAARMGSIPYAGYHSEGDTPGVVDPDQLDRVGTIAWAWLSSL
jgi:hypothetical protein